jgi:hypothetical protein
MKGGRFIGVVAFIIAFVILGVWGYMSVPKTRMVLAARETIPAGTYLMSVPDTMLEEVKLYSDATAMGMYLSRAQFNELAASGAYFTENIHQNEMLRIMAVASEINPEQSRRAMLGMTDPNLRDVVLNFDLLPTGLLTGDCVDLAVVVSNINDLAGGDANAPAVNPGFNPTATDEPVYPNITLTPTLSPTPTLTPTPRIVMPMAKFVVMCARVVNVIYETQLISSGSDGAQFTQGRAVGLELVVPLESAEFLALASKAGVLVVFQRPYSPEDAVRKPSLGASMQDFLDMFYADREEIAKSTPAAPAQ